MRGRLAQSGLREIALAATCEPQAREAKQVFESDGGMETPITGGRDLASVVWLVVVDLKWRGQNGRVNGVGDGCGCSEVGGRLTASDAAIRRWEGRIARHLRQMLGRAGGAVQLQPDRRATTQGQRRELGRQCAALEGQSGLECGTCE